MGASFELSIYQENARRQRERMYGRVNGNNARPRFGGGLIPTGILPASSASETPIVPSLISAPIILNAAVQVPDQLSDLDPNVFAARIAPAVGHRCSAGRIGTDRLIVNYVKIFHTGSIREPERSETNQSEQDARRSVI